MRLSGYFSPDEVLRDAEFDRLCLSNSAVPGNALSFLEDPRFLPELNANPHICAVICLAELVDQLAPHIAGIVVSPSPRVQYFQLHNRLAREAGYAPAMEPTEIAPGCRISPLAVLDENGVTIEENVVIEPFCVIKGPCRIGKNSILHAGVQIGGSGFEFKRLKDRVLDVAHCGGVAIGEDVVLWEYTTVHKAVYPWDRTTVGSHSRIGAHCHIDHGAKLGEFSELCAGAIVSGRAGLGARTYLGPGAIVSNRIVLEDGARASLGSVVTKDVPAGETVSGNFAIDHKKFLSNLKKSLEDQPCP